MTGGPRRFPLFGASDEGAAGLVVFATLAGGAVVWVANWYSARRDKRRQEAQQDEATAISRLEALNARIDAERKDLKSEIAVLRDKCTRTEVTLARAVTWIKMLESMLEREKIPHPIWTEIPTGDTGNHRPVSEGRRDD